MSSMEIKRNRENYEISIFHGKKKKSQYNTILNKDYNQIAQVLIDLYLEGFAIEQAITIFQERIRRRDWLGIKE